MYKIQIYNISVQNIQIRSYRDRKTKDIGYNKNRSEGKKIHRLKTTMLSTSKKCFVFTFHLPYNLCILQNVYILSGQIYIIYVSIYLEKLYKS